MDNTIDYRYSNGNIGQYKGYDIIVVPEEDFDLGRSKSKDNKKVIFALASGKRDNLPLIAGGMWIGDLAPDGSNIEMFKSSRFWGDEEELINENEWEIIDKIDLDTSTFGKTIEDYKPGESSIDRFSRLLRF